MSHLGRRMKLVVALHTAITMALAWTAHAWIRECDRARAQYEVAVGEWLAGVEALDAATGALAAHAAQVAQSRDDAVAFRNGAFNELREVEGDVAGAGSSMVALRAQIVQCAEDIQAYERRLVQAARAGVPVWEIAAARDRSRPRVLVGTVDRVDVAARLVFVDLGKGDGITEGTRFDVRRGERFICQVLVKTVNEDDASAWIIAETLGEGRSPQVGDRILRAGDVAPRRIEGTVERVDLRAFLIDIDIGRDDGAVDGTTFTVFRGDQYVCKAQIKTLGDHQSSAWILLETRGPGRAPERGDRVQNHD